MGLRINSKRVKALGLSKDQLNRLDEMDGKKDGKIEQSVFDAAKAYKAGEFKFDSDTKHSWYKKLGAQHNELVGILSEDVQERYPDGTPKVSHEDFNFDGKFDTVVEYYANGERKSETIIGTNSWNTKTEWYEDGHTKSFSLDKNGDEKYDEIRKFDENGRLKETHLDTDYDGELDTGIVHFGNGLEDDVDDDNDNGNGLVGKPPIDNINDNSGSPNPPAPEDDPAYPNPDAPPDRNPKK